MFVAIFFQQSFVDMCVKYPPVLSQGD